MGERRNAAAAVAVAAGVVLLGVATTFGREINLGPADALALDQPTVTFGIEDPANPGVDVGPLQVNSGILDTGSNGILLAAAAYSGGESYPVATRSDGSTVQYTETGAAGMQGLDVFQPVGVTYQPSGDDNLYELTNVRPLGSADVDLGDDIAGLVGMPGMRGHVVHMDLKPLGQGDFMSTEFLSNRPAATAGTTFHVPLTYLPPAFPGQQQPNDPLPTYSAAPMLSAVDTHGTHASSLNMLLDTGAQTSILSTASATALGYNLDPNSPTTDIEDIDGDGKITADDYLPVSGIGGTVDAPFIHVDKIAIPTAEGDSLVFTDLDVLVLDVAGLDGVFGMNMLTSGYFDAAFGGTGGIGAFGDIYLDFTSDSSALMQLEVNPDLVTAAPEPAAGVMVTIAAGAALLRRRRRGAGSAS